MAAAGNDSGRRRRRRLTAPERYQVSSTSCRGPGRSVTRLAERYLGRLDNVARIVGGDRAAPWDPLPLQCGGRTPSRLTTAILCTVPATPSRASLHQPETRLPRAAPTAAREPRRSQPPRGHSCTAPFSCDCGLLVVWRIAVGREPRRDRARHDAVDLATAGLTSKSPRRPTGYERSIIIERRTGTKGRSDGSLDHPAARYARRHLQPQMQPQE